MFIHRYIRVNSNMMAIGVVISLIIVNNVFLIILKDGGSIFEND